MEKIKMKQKEEALERMKKLEMLPACISSFEKDGKVMLSMTGILYDLNSDYQKIIDEWQKSTGNLVYHVILNHFTFGLCLSMLYVSMDDEEWEYDRQDLVTMTPLVYVKNMDDEWCSEYGCIQIRKFHGGLRRTA